jgi:hypothetical protein
VTKKGTVVRVEEKEVSKVREVAPEPESPEGF